MEVTKFLTSDDTSEGVSLTMDSLTSKEAVVLSDNVPMSN